MDSIFFHSVSPLDYRGVQGYNEGTEKVVLVEVLFPKLLWTV